MRFIYLPLSLLLICAAPTLWAESGLRQLNAFLQELNTLQAGFRQTVQPTDDDNVYTSSGVFYLKRPGQLRWEYEDPATQVIVADGKRIWLHDLELEQVSHRSQKAAL
ncbi:MAG: outer-membrane lipoprotein carrier protein LolA, partial [Candidatus Thiodiazotropha sp.]